MNFLLKTCISCDKFGYCLKCNESYYLTGVNDDTKCSKCLSTCETCESLNNCNDDNKCGDGFIRCYNGRCVEDDEKSYYEKCTNEIGCPLNKPYRCANGECSSSQRKCEIISTDDKKVMLNTICDSSKPYLCSDYSCESDFSFCKITIQCLKGQYKCFNGYCEW